MKKLNLLKRFVQRRRELGCVLGLILLAMLCWLGIDRERHTILEISRPTIPPAIKTFNPTIRVNLSVAPMRNVRLRCDGPFFITPVGSTRRLWQGHRLAETEVKVITNGLSVSGVKLPTTRFEIHAERSPAIWVNGTQYRGTIRVLRTRDGRMVVVNAVPLEAYLASVVDSEMPLEFGREPRMAQCITARTYALYQMTERRSHPQFDLYATTNSQRYLGVQYPNSNGTLWAGESSDSREVVAETRGAVCTFRGDLFCTYFSAACGGSSTRGRDVFRDAAPPMQEAVPCEWCRDADLYRWTRTFSEGDLTRLAATIRNRRAGFHNLKSVTDKADSFETARPSDPIELTDGMQKFSATHWELRRDLLPGKLPSPMFHARMSAGTLTFSGRGHGHGVGFCQWGSRGQGKAGRSAEQILAHYYPGSTLVRLTE